MSEIRKFDWNSIASNTARPQRKPETANETRSQFYPHQRARLNRIPGPEELSRRINDALDALARGVFWDRGSIVNIVL